MKLLLHVLRHDVIRLRGWLLGWAAVSALEMLEVARVGHVLPTGEGAARALFLTAFGAAQASLWLAALTVVASIHADSAVVSTRFWLTRPISRRLLLAAKLTLVLLLALGGTAVQVVEAATHGAELALLAEVFCYVLFVRLFILLAVAALAAITPDTGRFVLVFLLSVCLIPIVGRLAVAILGFHAIRDVTILDQWIVAMTVALVCSLAVLALQTLTRRHWPSVALCFGGIALVVASGIFWPWHLAFLGRLWPERSAPSLVGASLAVDASRLQIERGRVAGASFILRDELRLTGLPDGEAAVVAPIRTRVSWQSGQDAVLDGSAEAGIGEQPRTPPSSDGEFDAAADALHATWLNGRIGERPPTLLGVVTPRDAAQSALVESSLAARGTLTLTADVTATPVTLVARLPAVRGANVSFGTSRVTILAADSTDGQLRVVLLLREVQRPFSTSRPLRVALVNRRSREMLADPWARPSGPFSPLTAIQRREISCTWGYGKNGSDVAAIAPSWFADADVCLFEVGQAQHLRRTLRLTNLTIAQQTAGPDIPRAR